MRHGLNIVPEGIQMTSVSKKRTKWPASRGAAVACLSLVVALLLAPPGVGFSNAGLEFNSIAAYADDAQMDDRADSDGEDTPDTPDTPAPPPATPDIPDTPDTPDIPDTPDTPDAPDIPDTPDTPDAPDTQTDGAQDSDDDASGGGDTASDEQDESNRGVSRPQNLSEFLASLRNGSRIVSAERDGDNIEIRYSDGWEEQIRDGEYLLSAPNDNIVIRRPANPKDYARLSTAF